MRITLKKRDFVIMDSPEIPCYFRVKFGNEIKFIDLPWNDLSFANFKEKCKYYRRLFFLMLTLKLCCYCSQKIFISVVSEFNVQLIDGSDANLKVTDNLGANISRETFSDIIKTFYNGSMFTVNVSYDWKVMRDSFQLVTPLVCIDFE